MSINCEKASELFGLPGNEIVERIEKFTSDTSIAEKKSWGGIIA